jgi:hypothetical protein
MIKENNNCENNNASIAISCISCTFLQGVMSNTIWVNSIIAETTTRMYSFIYKFAKYFAAKIEVTITYLHHKRY